MSRSIMRMADEILEGMLTNSPVTQSSSAQNSHEESTLPVLSEEQRNHFINESVTEKLGPELKPHAKQGEASFSPSTTQKHTSVNVPPKAQKKLSPGAQQKLKKHKQRSASREDEKTSWAVDRPQSSQSAKWSRESDRQRKHQASRGTPTRGAKPSPGTTKVVGHDKPNTDIQTSWPRQQSLSPEKQATMAKKAPAHAAARRVKAVQKDKADMETWKRTNPAMAALRKQKAGVKNAARKAAAQNSGRTNMNRRTMTLVEKGKKDDDWIQGATADIKRRGTEGKCTPITKKGCTGRAKALARTFKKMGKENANLSRKQQKTLIEARNILREVIGGMTTVGSLGVNMKGMGGSAYLPMHMNKASNDNTMPSRPNIEPVDKSLRKVDQSKLKGKKASKKKKKKKSLKKESFEKFLDAIISQSQEI